jgi:hypothetical protein
VESIILEEDKHLEEMINQLKSFSPDWQLHAEKAVGLETRLFDSWVKAVTTDISEIKLIK